jgi:endoglycosylceramidase
MIRGSLDPGVQGGFQDFFSDKDGFKTAYLQRLEDIAKRFSGVSGVIGYDLLNEPFLDLFEQDLLSLYREAAVRIWQVDKSAILFLEPNLVTDTGKQTSLFFRPIEGPIATLLTSMMRASPSTMSTLRPF